MHLTNNRMFRLAGCGVGLILTASLALASQASFNLPFEAHIGPTTLSPGEYRISAPEGTVPIHVIYLYGNGKTKVTLPLVVGNQLNSDRSYLELVNVGGTYFVTKYSAGDAGKIFTFGLPKNFLHKALANNRTTSIAVTGGVTN